MLPAIMKPLLDGTFVRKDASSWRGCRRSSSCWRSPAGSASTWPVIASTGSARKLVMDLRIRMFRKLLERPTAYYDDHPAGNLISKVTFDVTQVTAPRASVLTVVFKDTLAIPSASWAGCWAQTGS